MAAKIIATANSRRSAPKKKPVTIHLEGVGGKRIVNNRLTNRSAVNGGQTVERRRKRGKFNRAHIHPWLAVFQCPSLRRARFYHNTFLTIHGAVVSFHSVVTIIRRLLFFFLFLGRASTSARQFGAGSHKTKVYQRDNLKMSRRRLPI